jgi:hypothetical protein
VGNEARGGGGGRGKGKRRKKKSRSIFRNAHIFDSIAVAPPQDWPVGT